MRSEVSLYVQLAETACGGMGLAKKVRYMKRLWVVKEHRRRYDLLVRLSRYIQTMGIVYKEMGNYNTMMVSSLSGLIEP